MNKYIKIAWRNIFRNKRRTVLVVIMIMFAVSLSLLFEGFLEDMRQGWLKAVIHGETGHIQIMRKGYLESSILSPLDCLISSPKEIEGLLKKDKDVVGVTKRISFGGLIAVADKTTIFNGIGVDPANEYKIFSLLEGVKIGKRLYPYHRDACVIGCGLAKYLGVGIGDMVTLLTNTVEGAMNAINVEVVGIFETGRPEVDNMCLSIPLSSSQNLLYTEKVSSIILLLKDIEDVPRYIEGLKRRLNEKRMDVEIHPWYELATLYKKVMAMNRFQLTIVEIIMFLLVGLALSNVSIMSTFERTKEIGTMTAFGIRQDEIMKLFLSESSLIGIIGGIGGIIGGIIVVKILYLIGIPFVPPGSTTPVYMRPILQISNLIFAFIFASLISIIGGIYPAWRASRIKPVEALRFV